MKQVWKCGFCSRTDEDKDKMTLHEKQCIFNPTSKKCETCKYKEYGEYEHAFCIVRCGKVDFDYFLDVTDNEIKCDFWEKENNKTL